MSNRKNILASLLFTAVGAFFAVAIGAPSATGDERQLIELERELSVALAKQDAVALNRLWGESLIFTFPDGKMSNKAQRLAIQKPSAQPSQSDSDMSSNNDVVKVHIYGKSAVVTVLTTWRGGANNQSFSSQFQATHVWIQQKGRWQLVAAHVSQVKK